MPSHCHQRYSDTHTNSQLSQAAPQGQPRALWLWHRHTVSHPHVSGRVPGLGTLDHPSPLLPLLPSPQKVLASFLGWGLTVPSPTHVPDEVRTGSHPDCPSLWLLLCGRPAHGWPCGPILLRKLPKDQWGPRESPGHCSQRSDCHTPFFQGLRFSTCLMRGRGGNGPGGSKSVLALIMGTGTILRPHWHFLVPGLLGAGPLAPGSLCSTS